MVWIQGGGYVFGTSGLPEYDGGRLARDGGVVVVTLNYRVGVEGFAQLEGAPANRGLLDQVAALEWVRDNIPAFGGDPDRVTVFGQSAGGGSVAALLAMPRAAGLFRRAVAQSVPGTFFSPELAADIAAACAAELGLRPTVADLSAVDPARLSAAGDAVGATMEPAGATAGARPRTGRSPSRRSSTARSCRHAVAGAGRRRRPDVELLVGHTRDEQRLFTVDRPGCSARSTEEQAAAALRRLRPRPGRRPPLPRGLPGRRPGGALRAGPLRLAVPDAVAAPRRGAGGRRRPGARLRADLAGPGHGRRLRRLPRPRRAARASATSTAVSRPC